MGRDILHIKNISKSYFNNSTHNNYVLENISLNVETNSITSLIGGNGAGKTTLFNVISRFTEPDDTTRAKIMYKNENLLTLKPHQLGKRGIARIFQGTHTFESLSVLENMIIAQSDYSSESPFKSAFSNFNSTEKYKKELAMGILNGLFDKNSIFNTHPNTLAKNLSFGQKRLLSLACLMMGKSDLILMDEPTAGINAQLVEKIKELLLLLKTKGKTIFLIEHNIPFVSSISDTVYFLWNNKIHLSGNAETVLNNKDVRKNYLGI